jgi:hypothetical protein
MSSGALSERNLGILKVLEIAGAGEGNRTLVFSLEVRKFRSVSNSHSDILQLFVALRSLQNFSLSERRTKFVLPTEP